MSTNITLDNRTETTFGLETKPLTDNWEPGTYQIHATKAPAGKDTLFLTLNRDEGIRAGKLYMIGTGLEDAQHGEICSLQEKLVGLAIGSEIWARIVAQGGASTPWIQNGKHSFEFAICDGPLYRVTLDWVPTVGYDDLRYTIEEIRS